MDVLQVHVPCGRAPAPWPLGPFGLGSRASPADAQNELLFPCPRLQQFKRPQVTLTSEEAAKRQIKEWL